MTRKLNPGSLPGKDTKTVAPLNRWKRADSKKAFHAPEKQKRRQAALAVLWGTGIGSTMIFSARSALKPTRMLHTWQMMLAL